MTSKSTNFYSEKRRLALAMPGIIEKALIDGNGIFKLNKVVYDLERNFECSIRKPLLDFVSMSDVLSYDRDEDIVSFIKDSKAKKVMRK